METATLIVVVGVAITAFSALYAALFLLLKHRIAETNRDQQLLSSLDREYLLEVAPHLGSLQRVLERFLTSWDCSVAMYNTMRQHSGDIATQWGAADPALQSLAQLDQDTAEVRAAVSGICAFWSRIMWLDTSTKLWRSQRNPVLWHQPASVYARVNYWARHRHSACSSTAYAAWNFPIVEVLKPLISFAVTLFGLPSPYSNALPPDFFTLAGGLWTRRAQACLLLVEPFEVTNWHALGSLISDPSSPMDDTAAGAKGASYIAARPDLYLYLEHRVGYPRSISQQDTAHGLDQVYSTAFVEGLLTSSEQSSPSSQTGPKTQSSNPPVTRAAGSGAAAAASGAGGFSDYSNSLPELGIAAPSPPQSTRRPVRQRLAREAPQNPSAADPADDTAMQRDQDGYPQAPTLQIVTAG
jgi:hypothetical protein